MFVDIIDKKKRSLKRSQTGNNKSQRNNALFKWIRQIYIYDEQL